MRDWGLQRIDREREDRKDQSIKNIQKTVPGLCLTARKNPSISPGGFGFCRVSGQGLTTLLRVVKKKLHCEMLPVKLNKLIFQCQNIVWREYYLWEKE